MIINILLALAVIIIVLVVIVSLQPSEFRVTRSATMAASPATVFDQINDLHKWEAWSPWAKMDPTSKSTFAGSPSGTGAVMGWAGNNKVGEGRMTITESRPGERIRLKLEFFKPFKAVNTAEFTFKAEGNQTVVNWCMFGPNNFMGKAFGLIMNCDKMVGGQFEQGLAAMKTIAEGAGKK